MEHQYSDEAKAFLTTHQRHVLNICNNRNLIIADYVVFREFDNGGLNIELFKDEHWGKMSMHKQADVGREFIFFIPRLVLYFYNLNKNLITN